jgi:mRNA interferase RelE/StbE
MKLVYGPRFLRDYDQLDAQLQRRVDQQIALLLRNPRHPSLRVHKMEGYTEIYEARVTKGYRLTFQLRDDTCILRRIGTHDILKTP